MESKKLSIETLTKWIQKKTLTEGDSIIAIEIIRRLKKKIKRNLA